MQVILVLFLFGSSIHENSTVVVETHSLETCETVAALWKAKTAIRGSRITHVEWTCSRK